jgi:ssRNA-specific RNase YbeY (16S rRNA maturation enzyme)
MKVNICGLTYDVVQDIFSNDLGEISYRDCTIHISKRQCEQSLKETLCHEMVHGMLEHLGYRELNDDEQFVQSLANAIYQGFEIKAESEDKE